MKTWPRAARWVVYAVIALLFAIACAFLSNWQFVRGEERAAANALVENNYDADPIAFDELMSGTDDFDPDDEWQPVLLTGHYLPDEQLLVRNRPRGGTSAYEVIVPFELDDGRIVAVDRGWVPPEYGGDEVAAPDAPTGEITVIARARGSEPQTASGQTAPDGQLPTIHVPTIADLLGENVVTPIYTIMVSEDPAPADAPNAIEAPEIDAGPHLSYAIQWILFAVMGFVFIGYMIRTEIRANREDDTDDDEDDEDDLDDLPPRRKPRARRPKRRDRDADAEDAILDAI